MINTNVLVIKVVGGDSAVWNQTSKSLMNSKLNNFALAASNAPVFISLCLCAAVLCVLGHVPLSEGTD